MNSLVDDFWGRLEGILKFRADQLIAKHSEIRFHIGKSSNNAFPLRTYLSILKDDDGDEIAITVNIKKLNDGFLIEADIISENGVTISEGPSLELHNDLSCPSVQIKIDEWFKSFDYFFINRSSDIDIAIKNLS